MSGHSKWHSIKHKKGAEDKKRGKIFTKHAKLVAIAARGGGDPNMNPSLRIAIENARAENMPRENIERAIKKGTGEGKDGVQMEEVFYEGFGPGGVALYIETLTDNKNRTVTNLKHVIAKNGGNLGAAGSVGYLFKKKGRIEVPLFFEGEVERKKVNIQKLPEEIEMAAIEAGAEDLKKVEMPEGDSESFIEIYTEPQDLMKVKSALESGGIKVGSAAMTHVPQTTVALTEKTAVQALMDLIEVIEEDEDVNEVFTNAENS